MHDLNSLLRLILLTLSFTGTFFLLSDCICFASQAIIVAAKPLSSQTNQIGIDGQFIVKGLVVDSDNQPAPGCIVRLSSPGNMLVGKTITDSDGNFRVSIDINSATSLVVQATSKNQKERCILFHTDAGGEFFKRLKLRLEKEKLIKVDVRSEGKPDPGLRIYAIRNQHVIFESKPDHDGKATVKIPKSARLDSIWAFGKEQGIGFWFSESTPSKMKVLSSSVTIQLCPKRKCRVSVVDEFGNSVPNLKVWPFFRVSDDSNRKFLPKLTESFETTDKFGVAEFAWIPNEPETWFLPTPVEESVYTYKRDESNKLSDSSKLLSISKLPEKFIFKGKLVGAKGQDLSDVVIFGVGYSKEAGRTRILARSNENGEFSAKGLPGQRFYLVASGPKWSSELTDLIILDDTGKQVVPLNIDLQPSTAVRMKFTYGDREPRVVKDGGVSFSLTVLHREMDRDGKVQTAKLRLSRFLWVDKSGVVNIGLGPGNWELRPQFDLATKTQQLKISPGQKSLSMEIHLKKQQIP